VRLRLNLQRAASHAPLAWLACATEVIWSTSRLQSPRGSFGLLGSPGQALLQPPSLKALGGILKSNSEKDPSGRWSLDRGSFGARGRPIARAQCARIQTAYSILPPLRLHSALNFFRSSPCKFFALA
jgi:hypothetical protein